MTDRTLRELRMHGKSDFPIATYERDYLDENDLIIECHWHDEWEFLAICKGHIMFSIDGKKQLMQEHDVVCIPGNCVHMAEIYSDSFFCFRSIVFSISMLYGMFNDIVQTKYIVPICENQEDVKVFLPHDLFFEKKNNAFGVFDEIYCMVERKSDCYEIFTKAYLYELIACTILSSNISDKPQMKRAADSPSHNIKKTIIYMIDNIQNQITLAELASIANMSTGHFSKLFRQMTSYSPIEYLINLRLSNAADRLRKNNDPIIHIALDVGFNNIGHFIRSFEKKYGCVPREYRQDKG